MIYTDGVHLFADTTEELHSFARGIFLKRSWFQDKENGAPHYDLTTEGKVHEAVNEGAVGTFGRCWVRIVKAHREGKPYPVVERATMTQLLEYHRSWNGADRNRKAVAVSVRSSIPEIEKALQTELRLPMNLELDISNIRTEEGLEFLKSLIPKIKGWALVTPRGTTMMAGDACTYTQEDPKP